MRANSSNIDDLQLQKNIDKLAKIYAKEEIFTQQIVKKRPKEDLRVRTNYLEALFKNGQDFQLRELFEAVSLIDKYIARKSAKLDMNNMLLTILVSLIITSGKALDLGYFDQ